MGKCKEMRWWVIYVSGWGGWKWMEWMGWMEVDGVYGVENLKLDLRLKVLGFGFYQ